MSGRGGRQAVMKKWKIVRQMGEARVTSSNYVVVFSFVEWRAIC